MNDRIAHKMKHLGIVALYFICLNASARDVAKDGEPTFSWPLEFEPGGLTLWQTRTRRQLN